MEKGSFSIDKDFDEPNVFKNILKGVKIPLLLVGLDGRIKFFTSYYKKILGDVELHVGMDFQKFLYPDDIDILINLYEKGIKEGKSYLSENIEFRIRRIDGEYMWVIKKEKIKTNSMDLISVKLIVLKFRQFFAIFFLLISYY